MTTPILSPSLLSSDFSDLKGALDLIEKAGGKAVHIDVMDGHFVPNLTIGVPVVKSIRKVTDIPLDVHTENPQSSGGFIRHYEAPEIVRVTAPVYLKTGGSVAKTHSWDTTVEEARMRAKQVSLVKRMLDVYYPEAIQSPIDNTHTPSGKEKAE